MNGKMAGIRRTDFTYLISCDCCIWSVVLPSWSHRRAAMLVAGVAWVQEPTIAHRQFRLHQISTLRRGIIIQGCQYSILLHNIQGYLLAQGRGAALVRCGCSKRCAALEKGAGLDCWRFNHLLLLYLRLLIHCFGLFRCFLVAKLFGQGTAFIFLAAICPFGRTFYFLLGRILLVFTVATGGTDRWRLANHWKQGLYFTVLTRCTSFEAFSDWVKLPQSCMFWSTLLACSAWIGSLIKALGHNCATIFTLPGLRYPTIAMSTLERLLRVTRGVPRALAGVLYIALVAANTASLIVVIIAVEWNLLLYPISA